MIVALLGATGLTGQLTLERLLQHDAVTSVIVFGRKPSPVTHHKLQQLQLQALPDTLPAVDAFICCIGTTIKKAGSKAAFIEVDRTLPVQLATQLHARGCSCMAVVSSMSASPTSPFFYTRVKGDMEEDLKQIGFTSLHILRPSIIDGPRQENRPMEKFGLAFTKLMHPLMLGSLQHYKAIKATTIADGLLHAVLQHRPGQFTYLSADIPKIS